MAPLKDISWKHVVVIVTFLVVLAAMLAAKNEVAIFLAVGMAVLAGIGVVAAQQASNNKETQVVREQTNGTQTAMVNHLVDVTKESQALNRQLMLVIERLGERLAASVPPEVVPALAAMPDPVYESTAIPIEPRDQAA